VLQTAGAAVVVNLLPPPGGTGSAVAAVDADGWAKAPGVARYRIDGVRKVRGEKIYARDFRARDMSGWPASEKPVMIVRAIHADRPFLGLNLDLLPPPLAPERVVLASDLLRDGLVKPDGIRRDLLVDMAEHGLRTSALSAVHKPKDIVYDFLVRAGHVPDFLGQPVAILIFSDARAFRGARKRIRFDPAFQRYGSETGPGPAVLFDPLTDTVRWAGDDAAEDEFSYARDGGVPHRYARMAGHYRARIELALAENTSSGDWLTFERGFSMRAMDPMFMEPETGLAWYEAGQNTLNLVVGTQSPDHDLADTAAMLADRSPTLQINLTSCYPGGGFGGRDTWVFTLYLAIAAAHADGPVRLAHDRFEQFQAGLKRHPCRISERLAVDRDGQIQALVTDMLFDAGGRRNLSPYVASLACLCAGGSYRVPRAAIRGQARHSTNVSGGSQRGFGGPQAFFAIETVLDEAAEALRLSPFELRRRNVLHEGDRTVVGGPILAPLRLDEILSRAERHHLWQGRQRETLRRQADGLLYGVGFATSVQSFGTGGDAVVGAVSLEADGRLKVTTNAVDMGNGSATTLAVSTALQLGNNAASIEMGNAAAFDALELTTGHDGNWQSSPRWVHSAYSSSSACITAFQQVHAIEQAARVLFHTGVLPAAQALWGEPVAAAQTAWRDGRLTAPGRPPLSLARLYAAIEESDGIAAAMVHAYFQDGWVEADYTVGGKRWRWPIAALALFPAGGGTPVLVDRQNGRYPTPSSERYSRTLFTPCGNLIAVTVDPTTGIAKVVGSASFLDAGRVITDGLVEGQSQGGVAMMIGYTLLEDMPPGLAGPAAGDWNLNRYHVPLAADVPLHDFQLHTLPPLPGDRTAKGIAEAVMCSIAPATANALAAATGHRFRDLPITPARIREALS